MLAGVADGLDNSLFLGTSSCTAYTAGALTVHVVCDRNDTKQRHFASSRCSSAQKRLRNAMHDVSLQTAAGAPHPPPTDLLVIEQLS
jgi:hypothetical protein